METTTSNLPHVVVIGGGISGLAAAYRLAESNAPVHITLLESSARVGGVLETVRRDGFLIERSADNFITNSPYAVDLCRRLGIESELISTEPSRRKAMVVRRGRLCDVPEGFVLMQPRRVWPVLTSPVLSLRGKLRLACECFIPRRDETGDESLASFTRRRLGGEVFDRLVQPLIGGIYTADPQRLSMAATLGRFQEMERRHGSLLRAAWKERNGAGSEADDSGARYSMFVAPREGMETIVSAIRERLPDGMIRLNAPVQSLERCGERWRVKLLPPPAAATIPRLTASRRRRRTRRNADASGLPLNESAHDAQAIDCDGVILATPAYAAANIVRIIDPALSDELGRIEHAGTSVVVLGYRREHVPRMPAAFGFVVPAIEQRRILAASFASEKFPGRAPDDHLLIRVFIGGALQPELAELDDEALIRIAREELGELIGAAGPPRLAEVCRWLGTMPQYHVGHLERVATIERLAANHAGLQLAGNAYHGVGIPQCIHSGEQAAERMLAARFEAATQMRGEAI